ncbi:hypothetical protein PF005_g703 [Phytophthora fragariae]|uniref:Uncharacterized protein n=2 Tax=Phytophthora TaxID=4783 RepID=A0A6A3TS45_9STRA|nr:hypothetical protein PF003_g8384 [Phytophthora fragariae]KAE8975087.1 hypothetical protein PR002_g25701 [Phytophthora rubi]KAE8950123.1 hypothetical protein PF009_g331 [Phytophthora fragariae]KAE8977823.1 hypothetical protein PR001_g25021 [Phytophthora rubi]KAE9141319.1 hypothetical protein PF007_g286 [Phytophthora fragariae]
MFVLSCAPACIAYCWRQAATPPVWRGFTRYAAERDSSFRLSLAPCQLPVH